MHENCKLAEQYAGMGWHVFPVWGTDEQNKCYCGGQTNCKAGKHPYQVAVARGHLDATTDIQTIKNWFKGSAVNVGINVKASGIVVIDFDVSNGKQGLEKLAEWEEQYGKMPITPTAKTGSGGRHYFFRATADLPTSNSGSWGCVDIVSNTALIVPPSKHVSGNRYEWIVPADTPLAEVPDWFIREYKNLKDQEKQKKQQDQEIPEAEFFRELNNLAEQHKQHHTEEELAGMFMWGQPSAQTFRLLGQLRAGERNSKVMQVIGSMFGSGFSYDLILRDGLAWAEQQSPPYDEADLRNKIDWIYKKEQAKAEEQEQEQEEQTTEEAEILLSSDGIESTIQQNPLYSRSAEADEAAEQPHLIGLLGDTIRQIEPQTEADPDGLSIALLTAFGSAVGRKPYIQIGARRHSCNIFTVLHGHTGCKKGEAWAICRALIGDTDWQDNCIEYQFGSGEGLIERVRDAGSTTDGNTIAGISDKRLLVINTEFSKTLTLCRRNDSTLQQCILNAWDGEPLRILNRKNNALAATDHHISIIGNITTKELMRTLKKGTEGFNGFANRFLWIAVKPQAVIAFPPAMQLGDLPKRWTTAVETAKQIGEMSYDDTWRELYQQIIPELIDNERDDSLSVSVFERARPYVYRLSMLFALLDGQSVMTERHLQAALSIWRLNVRSCRELFSEEQPELSNIIYNNLVMSGTNGLSRSDISAIFNRQRSAGEIDSAIQQLSGKIRREIVRTTGRPAERYWAVSA